MKDTRTKCREVILAHCRANPNINIKKVDFFVIGYEKGHSPVSVDRRLRELENEKIIKVSYYDGRYSKNLAQYSFGESTVKPTVKWVEVLRDDGTPIMMPIQTIL